MLSWKKNVGRTRQLGFTLVELLVALFVFALMSGFAYRAVNALMSAGEGVELEMKQLAEMQRAILFWERDARQFTSRMAHKDDTSDTASFANSISVPEGIEADDGVLVEFNRAGGGQRAGRVAGQVDRVQYLLQKNILYRQWWDTLDRVEEAPPTGRQALLTDVVSAKVELLGGQDGSHLPSGLGFLVSHNHLGLVERKIHLGMQEDLAMFDESRYGELVGVLSSAGGGTSAGGSSGGGGGKPIKPTTPPPPDLIDGNVW